MALDKKTGRELYTTEAQQGRSWADGWYGSHVHVKIGNEDVVLSPDGSLIRASDGDRFFKRAARLAASPAAGDGYAFVTHNDGRNLFYYKLPSSVEERPEAIKIDCAKDGFAGFINCGPLIHDKLAYLVSTKVLASRDAVLYVYDLAANKLAYAKELDFGDMPKRQDRPYGCGISASCALAGGKVFIVGNFGTTLILEPGSTYREIGRNTIEKRIPYPRGGADPVEGTISNPWFEGNRIYYRAQKHVYCIEGQ